MNLQRARTSSSLGYVFSLNEPVSPTLVSAIQVCKAPLRLRELRGLPPRGNTKVIAVASLHFFSGRHDMR